MPAWIPHLADRILVEALGDPCEEVRDFIVRELSGRRRPRHRPRLRPARRPALVRAERRPPDHRHPEGRNAVRHIERVLDDANADVRKCAADALGEIGGREVLRLLVRLKKDGNPYVRQAAEEGLRKASDLKFV